MAQGLWSASVLGRDGKPRFLADLTVNLGSQFGVALKEGFGLLPSLPQALVAVKQPTA
jgi:hypothetical protein